ncbi:XTP/dITP diphosphatase [Thermogemmatispora carboxidivorans]|uniref:XTP/dITP diphosphatase n=1 Tax=Thermogemmatispora carboxidivorans TaxID=1382306 RepID=UPI00069B02AC
MKQRETSDQPTQEPRRLLLATSNGAKLEELRTLFSDLPFHVVSPVDIGLRLEVEETGQTFRENAELKARAYAKASGLLALADDSGLEIDALGGAPGVYSARFMGQETPYEERFRFILQRLQGLPPEQRTARFRCCIAIAEPWGYCRTVEGVVEGQIAEEPRGSNGFGYDPIFLVPELGKTTAELSPEEKHRISHRGRAAQLARRLLASWPPFATSADLLDTLP